jgi:hypothetical protein
VRVYVRKYLSGRWQISANQGKKYEKRREKGTMGKGRIEGKWKIEIKK